MRVSAFASEPDRGKMSYWLFVIEQTSPEFLLAFHGIPVLVFQVPAFLAG
jgi:hypothetical protein